MLCLYFSTKRHLLMTDSVLASVLFIFMLVLLCFCVATVSRWIKIYIISESVTDSNFREIDKYTATFARRGRSGKPWRANFKQFATVCVCVSTQKDKQDRPVCKLARKSSGPTDCALTKRTNSPKELLSVRSYCLTDRSRATSKCGHTFRGDRLHLSAYTLWTRNRKYLDRKPAAAEVPKHSVPACWRLQGAEESAWQRLWQERRRYGCFYETRIW